MVDQQQHPVFNLIDCLRMYCETAHPDKLLAHVDRSVRRCLVSLLVVHYDSSMTCLYCHCFLFVSWWLFKTNPYGGSIVCVH